MQKVKLILGSVFIMASRFEMKLKKKCFCDEMEKGELCDYCEREKFLDQRADAEERFKDEWYSN
ncbi:hypothetical protein LCGC14_1214750 [marine sediment metagenome]|uniref:Uncharacterized protein n=1 Tax=marine sediment metagenome TaxID=412755 RepID=A0A0F9NVB9_9ZZZZ